MPLIIGPRFILVGVVGGEKVRHGSLESGSEPEPGVTWSVCEVYPESCAVTDGKENWSWLQLQGTSLVVASHVEELLEVAFHQLLGEG